MLAGTSEALPLHLTQANQGELWNLADDESRRALDGLVLSVQIEQLRRKRTAHEVGGLALRSSEVMLASDLCDLTEVHKEYDEFVLSVKPRSESETVQPKSEVQESLYDMMHGAAEGNAEAQAGVEANAVSIMSENVCKDGSILEVEAEMSDDGQIVQFGQKTRDRQRKTLEWYPDQSVLLRDNTVAEGRNASVVEYLWKMGMMKGKKALEISLVPKASTKELYDNNYFLDRMTVGLRLTEISDEGKVNIASGLVGGVDQDELLEYGPDETFENEMARYDQALDIRFDDDVAGEMLELFGLENARELSTTGKLGAVVVLPGDTEMTDVVQLWDKLASAKLGKPVFYGLRSLYKEHCAGRTPSPEDYKEQYQRSRDQQASLKLRAKAVAGELIRRRSEAINDLQAIKLLAEIAKKDVTRFVTEQPTVDARLIVGREAAPWVADAQMRLEWGDTAGAEDSISKAQDSARTTSCPSGGSKKSTLGPDDKKPEYKEQKPDSSQDSKSGSESKRKKGKKTEWMRCVHCPLCKRDEVTARIDYHHPAENKKRITCTTGCNGHKDYDM